MGHYLTAVLTETMKLFHFQPKSVSYINKSFFFKILILLFLVGCGSGSSYDKGYEDALDKKKNSLMYSINSSYKEGYDNGMSDLSIYDIGCYDADTGAPPNSQYSSDYNYMLGYEECQ